MYMAQKVGSPYGYGAPLNDIYALVNIVCLEVWYSGTCVERPVVLTMKNSRKTRVGPKPSLMIFGQFYYDW